MSNISSIEEKEKKLRERLESQKKRMFEIKEQVSSLEKEYRNIEDNANVTIGAIQAYLDCVKTLNSEKEAPILKEDPK